MPSNSQAAGVRWPRPVLILVRCAAFAYGVCFKWGDR